MSSTASFPFLLRSNGNLRVPMPILPMELTSAHGLRVKCHGLLDTGSMINVLPHELGVQLGARWELQPTRIDLSGILHGEARGLLLRASISGFPSVLLAFAWAPVSVPLILGQVNFFQAFDVRFQASRLMYHVQTGV